MAVQVSVRSAGKVTFVGTTSCVKVGATAETEGGKDGEVETRSSTFRSSFYNNIIASSNHASPPTLITDVY